MGKRYWYGFVIPKVLMTQNGYVRWNRRETMSGPMECEHGGFNHLGVLECNTNSFYRK
jgi:hypothetical protein